MTLVIMSAVKNEGPRISRMIQSIINQSDTDWILVISDNNSSDDTVTQSLRFSHFDKRILVWQRPNAVDPVQSWRQTFLRVSKDLNPTLIMPIAGDDYIEPHNFISVLRSALADSRYDFATPNFRNDKWKNKNSGIKRFRRLSTNTYWNQVRTIWCHQYGHMFYSMFRAEVYGDIDSRMQSLSTVSGLTVLDLEWYSLYFRGLYVPIFCPEATYIHTTEKVQTNEEYSESDYWRLESQQAEAGEMSRNSSRLKWLNDWRILHTVPNLFTWRYFSILVFRTMYLVLRPVMVSLLWALRNTHIVYHLKRLLGIKDA